MVKSIKKRIVETDAPLIKKVIAFLIDLLIIDVVVLMQFQSKLSGYTMKSLNTLAGNEALLSRLSFTLGLIFLLVLLYFTLFEYKLGQTPGKMMLKLWVRSKDGNMTFWKVLLRNMEFIPLFPFQLLLIADPLFLLFKNVRVSELLSKTKVVINTTQIEV